MAGDPGRGISYVPYHGCVLERKECSQVLDDVDSLEESLPDHLKPYLRTFRAVMVSICGIAPGPSWEDDIAVFKAEFLAVQQLFGLKEDQGPKLSSFEKNSPIQIQTVFGVYLYFQSVFVYLRSARVRTPNDTPVLNNLIYDGWM